ncbi:MAG TPA: hypothetical protein VEH27_17745 [Methylomirabilota bacterium]|nr:hypothetical protein [Methylomirabilota bacterium]
MRAHSGPHEEPEPQPGPHGLAAELSLLPSFGGPNLFLRGATGKTFEVKASSTVDGPFHPIRRVTINGAGSTNIHAWSDVAAPKRFYQAHEMLQLERAPDFELVDINDRAWNLEYARRSTNLHAVALAFVGQLSSYNADSIKALAASYKTNEVPVWIIDSSNVTRSELKRRVAGLGASNLVVLHDRTGAVGDAFAIKAFPTFVCVDHDGYVTYKGAREATIGAAGATDLLGAAIQSARAQAQPELLLTEATGAPTPVRQTPSYSSDIAPILISKCASCHSVGNVGPFAMTNHAVITSWATSIQDEVLAGHMPPWHADPEFGAFGNDRSLTPEEISNLVNWIEAGAPKRAGESDPLTTYVAPTEEWPAELGPPDAIIEMPLEHIKAEGVEAYRYRFTKSPFTSNVWLRAASVRPSNTAVAHHILVGKGQHTATFLHDIAGYVPGTEDRPFPEGMGRPLAANSPITFELHYTTMGVATTDKPRLALWLHKNPAGLKEFKIGFAANVFGLRIPAGASHYVAYAEAPIDRQVTLYSLTPHMHLRGKSMRFDLILPDGRKETLLNVPHYDFHWQMTYRLKEPRVIPAGSILQIQAAYDNSYMNIHNPDPTVQVRWGEQSWNEMLIGYFEYVE